MKIETENQYQVHKVNLMKPQIDKTKFGSITIDGEKYSHDILIKLDGEVHKRKKKLSKELYGTSHILSLAEAEFVYEEGAEKLIYGTGNFNRSRLSEEAENYFVGAGVTVQLLPTQKAIKAWNEAEGRVIGLFHITC